MSFLRPALLLLAVPAFLLLRHVPLSTRRLRFLRSALYALLILALAGLAIRLPRPSGTIVVLADRSASMPATGTEQQKEAVDILHRGMRNRHRLAVVSFAGGAQVELASGNAPLSEFKTRLDPHRSDLSAAIRAGLSQVPTGEPGRILVLSDGQWSGSEPNRIGLQCAARRIAIDYVHIGRTLQADTAILELAAPGRVDQNQAFLVTAWIESPEDQQADYRLTRNGQVLAASGTSLTAGRNRLLFRDQARRSGVYAYELTITPATADPVKENNHARRLVGVGGELPILAVSSTPPSGFTELIENAGLHVNAIAPGQYVGDIPQLASHSAVLIENVPAGDLARVPLERLAGWMEQSGRGLLVTGGRRSYGAGGYFGSALEPVLPVSMELRQEHRKMALAMVIVLDRSGSMSARVGTKTKIDLANIGSAQVLDLLSDMDEFGLIAVDSQPHTVVPIDSVTRNRSHRDKVLSVESMGGGIFVYDGLKAAVQMLMKAKCQNRHIILFADAADAEQPGDYKDLLERCRKAAISCSVVGLGTEQDPDAEFLKDVARRGEGEIYFTRDANDIPRLFAQDTFAVARSTFIEDPTDWQIQSGFSLLTGGRAFPAPPALGGYNLCYLRDGARLGALTRDEYEAPVIAHWQAGAGRVACYTGEAAGDFTGRVGDWPDYGPLLLGLVRWISAADPEPLPGTQLRQKLVPGGVRVELHLDPENPPASLGTPLVRVLRSGSDGTTKTGRAVLEWDRPDLLSATLPLYAGEDLVAAVHLVPERPTVLPPVCLPYSPEFVPRPRGSGRAALEELSQLTGGDEQVNVAGLWDYLPRRSSLVDLTPWFSGLAIILFLVEILERRVGLQFKLPEWGFLPGRRRPRRGVRAPRSRRRPRPAEESQQDTAGPAEPKPAEEDHSVSSALSEARRRARARNRRR